MSVTKPVVLDESYNDKMDELIEAVGSISLGNYVIVNINNYTWGSVVGAGVYPNNTPVTLTATPKTGCYFLAWRDANGTILSINPTYTFTPSGNTVIQADFNADEYVKIVSWANGTDVELNAMLDAHYRGVIDIHDYWSVGDTRTVHVESIGNYIGEKRVATNVQPAQNTEWVLMDTTLTGFSKANEEDTGITFAVGMKDCFSLTSAIGPTGPSWESYSQQFVVDWVNTMLPASLPALFLSLFKEFSWKVGSTSGDPRSDLFALTPLKCIIGTSDSVSPERTLYTQWEYYVTEANHIKGLGRNGTTTEWVTCSKTTTTFACISTDGSYIHGVFANEQIGISPFGCI